MKRLVLLVTVLMVAVGVTSIYAGGWKRIDTWYGDIYDTIGPTYDSTGVKELPNRIKWCDDAGNQTYDGFIAYFYIPTGVAISTNGDVGECDTGIINIYAGNGYWKQKLCSDTGTPPCTLLFRWTPDPYVRGAQALIETDSSSDSAWSGGYWYPQDTALSGNLFDQLWFDYYEMDSSAVGDTVQMHINYWIRAYEKE